MLSESTSSSRKLKCSKGQIEELLLICSVIGTTFEGELILNENILEWLRDLQLQVYKDRTTKADFCPACIQLGNLQIVKDKLLPIALQRKDDFEVLQTLSKILVQLTSPLTIPAQQAGLLNINTKSKKFTQETIQDQIKYKENAISQSKFLMEYKHLFCSKGVLSVFVEFLRPALEKQDYQRGDHDNQVCGDGSREERE